MSVIIEDLERVLSLAEEISAGDAGIGCGVLLTAAATLCTQRATFMALAGRAYDLLNAGGRASDTRQ